jgi:hypothetical protein
VLEAHVLHLIPAWEGVLEEVRRVLAAGGMLLHAGGGAFQLGSGGPRDQVMGRFDELAYAGDGPPSPVGAGSWEQVVDALAAMGGRVEELEPIVWEEPETYAEALGWVENRVFSSHWRLPDERWRGASAQLRAELEAAHPDLTVPQPTRHTLDFTAIRF